MRIGRDRVRPEDRRDTRRTGAQPQGVSMLAFSTGTILVRSRGSVAHVARDGSRSRWPL